MHDLTDCNHFFASCERVFCLELNERPIIVSSNNDGYIVARSDEAKFTGIKIGDPLFNTREITQVALNHAVKASMPLLARGSAQ